MRRCRASMREFKAYIRVFYAFAEYFIIEKRKALINYKIKIVVDKRFVLNNIVCLQ